MKNLPILIPLLLSFVMPVSALELHAPSVPDSAAKWMPHNTDSFSDGLLELTQKAILLIRPELQEAATVCLTVIISVLFISIIRDLQRKNKLIPNIAGTAAISAILLGSSNSLIHLAANTVRELSNYGKLLFPVMTAALAAQGGVTASAALYTGTAIVNAILGSFLSIVFVPGIYFFLSMAIGFSATGEVFLKRLRDVLKNAVSWCLKTILTVFTTYMSITGVVSGTTDAAALKATKLTISSAVPVVGGILSDASEAVLVSAGLMKNAAGIYGLLVILAVFLEPFIKIALQYLVLKITVAICSIFDDGAITTLVEDFSTAMGLLLAITGSVCLLQLISTVCFMKGVG